MLSSFLVYTLFTTEHKSLCNTTVFIVSIDYRSIKSNFISVQCQKCSIAWIRQVRLALGVAEAGVHLEKKSQEGIRVGDKSW